MKRLSILLLSLFIPCLALHGQNIVPNPGFEDYNECIYWVPVPGGGYPIQIAYSPTYNDFPSALHWIAPLNFTNPCYYNACDTTSFSHGVPFNTFGYQLAHSGVAYTGIHLAARYPHIWEDLRFYIESRLVQPMEATHEYRISFYVSLAASATSRIYGTFITFDNIGAYISDTMVSESMPFGNAFLTRPVTIRTPPGKFITDTAGWMKVEGTYLAHGGEQWITIGRFNDVLPTRDSFMFSIRDATHNDDSLIYCHVYIDDVCVMDISNKSLHVADTAFCAGAWPLSLSSPVVAAQYEWSTGDTSATISIHKPGQYWRQATGECFYFTDTFRVQATPVVYLGKDTTVCREIPLLLGNQQYDSRYVWNTGDTTCCIQTIVPGQYSVMVSNACGVTSDNITITENAPCDNCILVPNAFTPNADGINDVFIPQMRCPLYYYRLRVYNRYGQLVFETANMTDGWDGTYKGATQGLGVYYYYIEYATSPQGNREQIKGNVTVVR